jgi:hypothetical protein
MRSASALGIAALSAWLTGCDPAVLKIPETASDGPTGMQNNPDAAMPSMEGMHDGPVAANQDAGEDASSTAACVGVGDGGCACAQVTQDTGHHNPGMDCLTCHRGQQPTAPLWTLAGTIFQEPLIGTPAVGATIRIRQGNGTTVTLVSAENGNFYTDATLVFPISIEASKCPDTMAMPVTLPGPTVSCNNCHVTGGQAGERIHLP